MIHKLNEMAIKREEYMQKLSTYFLNGIYTHLIKLWMASDTMENISPEFQSYAEYWKKDWEKSAKGYFKRMLKYIREGNVIGTKKDKGYQITLQDFFVSNDVEMTIDSFLNGYEYGDKALSDIYKHLDTLGLDVISEMKWVSDIKNFLFEIFEKTEEENMKQFEDLIKKIEG